MLDRTATIGWKPAWAALVLAAAVATALGGAATGSADGDWPCVQRLMPELSAAAVWDGPDLGNVGNSWHDRPETRRLVSQVASRRTDMAETEKAIAAFAEGLGADKDATLTAVFAGVFAVINDDRSQLIAGIKRYATNQQRLAEKIRQTGHAIETMATKSVAENDPRLQQLREQWEWDTRIHKDRERSLAVMCEQPVLFEQRLFHIARAVRAAMTR